MPRSDLHRELGPDEKIDRRSGIAGAPRSDVAVVHRNGPQG